jgi:hypothetical protein
MELQPGPPLSHIIMSSRSGLSLDSNHQKKRCLSSSAIRRINIEEEHTDIEISTVSCGDILILTKALAIPLHPVFCGKETRDVKVV